MYCTAHTCRFATRQYQTNNIPFVRSFLGEGLFEGEKGEFLAEVGTVLYVYMYVYVYGTQNPCAMQYQCSEIT